MQIPFRREMKRKKKKRKYAFIVCAGAYTYFYKIKIDKRNLMMRRINRRRKAKG